MHGWGKLFNSSETIIHNGMFEKNEFKQTRAQHDQENNEAMIKSNKLCCDNSKECCWKVCLAGAAVCKGVAIVVGLVVASPFIFYERCIDDDDD